MVMDVGHAFGLQKSDGPTRGSFCSRNITGSGRPTKMFRQRPMFDGGRLPRSWTALLDNTGNGLRGKRGRPTQAELSLEARSPCNGFKN
jgi:hypothetical protein